MHKASKDLARTRNFSRSLLIVLSGAFLMAGCAGPQVAKKGPVFFPGPPNEPKVQFLKSISGSADVEDQRSKLQLLVSGATEKDTNRPIVRPYGVRYVKGKLYVSDTQGPSTVDIMDLRNKTFNYLKENPGRGQLKKPINLEVDVDGSIYVADTLKKEVMIYDPTGTFTGSIGREQNMKPVDVALDKDFIYALDLNDSDIKIYDRKTLQYVRSIGKTEDKSQGLALPTNLTIDDKGLIYVTNITDATVKIYDKDGHFINKIGQLGDALGEFTRPKGIAVDPQHRIWVVDGAFQNVQVFNENRRMLMFFGDPPLVAGALNLPAGIALTTEDLDYFQTLADPDFILEQVIFVTNQMGDAKVSIYGLGHKKGAAPTSTAVPAPLPSAKPEGSAGQTGK
jgi:sugar lactone lactonase YvrE